MGPAKEKLAWQWHRMNRMMTMQQLMEDDNTFSLFILKPPPPPMTFPAMWLRERDLSVIVTFIRELMNTRIIEYSECTLLAQNVKVDMCLFTKLFSVQCHVYMHLFFWGGGGGRINGNLLSLRTNIRPSYEMASSTRHMQNRMGKNMNKYGIRCT